MKYIAKRRLWHTGEQRIYSPGETVTLEHLSESDINILLEKGTVIKQVANRRPRKKRVVREVRK